MKLIIARIDREDDLESRRLMNIKKYCQDKVIEVDAEVYTFKQLQVSLQSAGTQDILLHTNFPPGQLLWEQDEMPPEEALTKALTQDSTYLKYLSSFTFFKGLDSKHRFKSIHFHTGARLGYISDEDLGSLFEHLKPGISRLEDWPRTFREYQETLELFIRDWIRDSVKDVG